MQIKKSSKILKKMKLFTAVSEILPVLALESKLPVHLTTSTSNAAILLTPKLAPRRSVNKICERTFD